jgi:hypothetical protein
MCYTFISLLLDLEVRSDGPLRYVLLAWGKELYQWDEMSKHFIGQYTFTPLSVLGVRVLEVAPTSGFTSTKVLLCAAPRRGSPRSL